MNGIGILEDLTTIKFMIKQLILRTISGKFKIWITRYYFFENGKRRIKTIDEQHKEIKNSFYILQLLRNKINSNESYLDIAKSINFAYSSTWIYSKISSYNKNKFVFYGKVQLLFKSTNNLVSHQNNEDCIWTNVYFLFVLFKYRKMF